MASPARGPRAAPPRASGPTPARAACDGIGDLGLPTRRTRAGARGTQIGAREHPVAPTTADELGELLRSTPTASSPSRSSRILSSAPSGAALRHHARPQSGAQNGRAQATASASHSRPRRRRGLGFRGGDGEIEPCGHREEGQQLEVERLGLVDHPLHTELLGGDLEARVPPSALRARRRPRAR